MLKYFLLLLLAIPCLASEPKFHFMDCVKIKTGFYKNCSGAIQSWDGFNRYVVQSYDCRGGDMNAQFYENDLESSKGCV